jgi:hypothetical protein
MAETTDKNRVAPRVPTPNAEPSRRGRTADLVRSRLPVSAIASATLGLMWQKNAALNKQGGRARVPHESRNNTVLAVIHAPGVSQRESYRLAGRLRTYVSFFGFSASGFLLNPNGGAWEKAITAGAYLNVGLGWGLRTEPNWDRWLRTHRLTQNIRHLFAFDLFDRVRAKAVSRRPDRIGTFWGVKTRFTELQLLMNRIYLGHTVPYGYKLIPHKAPRQLGYTCEDEHFTLEFGDPDEVAIIRHIFQMYVNDGLTRANICNLLNAEHVKAPMGKRAWGGHQVDNILLDPVYIGSNRHCGCISPDAFPPLISKADFYRAQARLLDERVTKQVSLEPKVPAEQIPEQK